MKRILLLFIAMLNLMPMLAQSKGEFTFDGVSYIVTSSMNYTVEVVRGEKNYSGAITIPKSVHYKGEDYDVTSIGKEAFKGCSDLTSITLPNGVLNIKSNAFNGCSSLTSITLPKRLTHIWDFAFSGCTGLTSIEIPNSVTNIAFAAFRDCI